MAICQAIREFRSNVDVQWKAGKQDRNGVCTYSGGKKYKRTWKNGKEDGFGEIIYKFGTTYIGQWTDGHPNGAGTWNGNGGKYMYSGAWQEEHQNGKGLAPTLMRTYTMERGRTAWRMGRSSTF
eukprot:jgi/Botrbrau1/15541/Bobra.0333s0007.1